MENTSWKNWNIGDTIKWIVDEFDGHMERIGKVTQIFEDHVIVEADGMNLWVDKDTIRSYINLTKNKEVTK